MSTLQEGATQSSTALYLAWLAVTLATVGLYFLGAVPDKLAWFAVMPLASLAVVLGVAAYLGDARVRPYALSVLGIGSVLAALRVILGTPNADLVPYQGLYAAVALIANLIAFGLVWAIPRTLVTRAAPSPGLLAAAAVALIATLGSLYFSEVRHFVPCTLCWYQRSAMYPLALLLGLGAWRGQEAVRRFALPLAGAGWLVAVYHVAEEKFGFAPLGTCSVVGGVSCTTEWVNYLGVFTIPVLSLSAFTLILILLMWRRRV